ncbi:hypothetical protein [Shewanella psychropiezotolerans]|uniref:hypothetical protein n=1 Tax=Shewanella psychropiezotolerans TaxID=2593655 RepID=UPI002AD4A67E|nr:MULTISPECIES: hypothetical protein [Shewanella]
MNLPEEAPEKMLLRASGLSFFNISKMDMSKLGETGIKANLESYIDGFDLRTCVCCLLYQSSKPYRSLIVIPNPEVI